MKKALTTAAAVVAIAASLGTAHAAYLNSGNYLTTFMITGVTGTADKVNPKTKVVTPGTISICAAAGIVPGAVIRGNSAIVTATSKTGVTTSKGTLVQGASQQTSATTYASVPLTCKLPAFPSGPADGTTSTPYVSQSLTCKLGTLTAYAMTGNPASTAATQGVTYYPGGNLATAKSDVRFKILNPATGIAVNQCYATGATVFIRQGM